jgi:hypothetical protein
VVNLLKDDQGQDPEREKVYGVDVRIEAVQYYVRCKGTGTLKIALRDRHSLLSAGTLIISPSNTITISTKDYALASLCHSVP